MLGNAFLLAFRQIRRNPLRSLLTVLGIVIGVAAVITMVTVGSGAAEAVKEQIESFGSIQLMRRRGRRMGLRVLNSRTSKRSKTKSQAFCQRRLSRSEAPSWWPTARTGRRQSSVRVRTTSPPITERLPKVDFLNRPRKCPVPPVA